jgi:N-acetylglucosaminyl-diphospho-decaprenol L-rhamnosyltransferase
LLQLSIIIVSYNVKYFLEQCLSSVLQASKNIDAEIFVVDNNSGDGSKAFFNNRFPQVKFIWNEKNVGFAKANNQALKLAAGKNILFLNPDTIVAEDCIEKCLLFVSQTNDIGAIGVRMIDGSGRYLAESKRGFPSSFTAFCKITGLTKLFPNSKLFGRYYLGHLAENEVNKVDVLPGAFMMIPKLVLDKTGGFDETFFMYGEDIDLSYRIQQAGYINYYFPVTTIIHFKGESTQKKSKEYTQYFYGAMLLFVKKHYGQVQFFLYSLLIKSIIAVKGSYKTKLRQDLKKHQEDSVVIICAPNEFEEIKNSTCPQYWNDAKRADDINGIDKNATAVILCEPAISFTQMISLIEKQQPADFFIHATGSKSIIASSDKNRQGLSIAIDSSTT